MPRKAKAEITPEEQERLEDQMAENLYGEPDDEDGSVTEAADDEPDFDIEEGEPADGDDNKNPQIKGRKTVNAKKRRLNPSDITEDELDYIYERRRTYTMEGRERSR